METAKVTVRDNEPRLRMHLSRPPSPSKLSATPQSAPRPKAKVNSSVHLTKTASVPSGTPSKTSTASATNLRSGAKSNASTTPRAVSPFKTPQGRNGATSPFKLVKARAAAQSTATPEPRHRPLTTVASDMSLKSTGRRHGSISLHSATSMVSIRRPVSPSAHTATLPQDGGGASQIGTRLTKVKSKVTDMIKHDVPSSLSLSPPSGTTRPRTRAPSISSTNSFMSSTSSPSPDKNTFYPITTATAAANPHRFATTRPSPPSSARHYYQPFPPKDELFINYSKQTVVPKADPATIPLPPHSPPTSTLSFSSRSSRSRSSVSYRADPGDTQGSFPIVGSPATHVRKLSLDATLQSSLALHNGSPDSEDEFSAGEQGNESDPGPGGEERKIKAEAKSNRKIADLEITNRSLLAINASLEAAKHQQAKELRELRRKLRESRLILPPRAYQAVTSSLNHDDDEEEEEEEEEEGLQENVGDESYRRIKAILEGLIETGKRALEAKPGDFSDSGKGGAKVLSAEEVRNWRGSSGDSEGQMKDGNCIGRPLTPSHIAVPHSDDEFFSEEEVEAIALALTSVSPPIHVTPSP